MDILFKKVVLQELMMPISERITAVFQNKNCVRDFPGDPVVKTPPSNATGAGSPGDSVVKNPPANTGDVGLSPVSERSLEKELAAQSSILAWKIPWTEEPGGSYP